MSRYVVALGGNALLRSGEGTVEAQRERVRETRDALSALRGEELVFTHGNGPQVGERLLAEEQSDGPAEPLDVLVAETQAQVGYLLQNGLGDAFGGAPAPVVTRVRVDPDDPGFDDPSKPVGPEYTSDEAAEKPFDTVEVHTDGGGTAHRRVVASPEPRELLEAEHVAALVADGGGPVVCGGGGGVPVVERASENDSGGEDGSESAYEGVPAVVDKDRTTRLVAEAVDADAVVMLTDVDAVYRNYGTDEQEPIREATPAVLRELADAGAFPAGSMGPKVEACARFVAENEAGTRALVTSPERLGAALDGDAGTTVRPE